MKNYTLKVFLNDTSVTETVTAEAHTIENGVFIFWVRNEKGDWCHVSIYPISCVAITRIQEAEGYAMVKVDSNTATNKTIDIEFLKEISSKIEMVTDKPKSKASKK